MNFTRKDALFAGLMVFGAVCLFMTVRGSGPWSAKVTMENNLQTLTVSRRSEVYYTVSLQETSGASGSYELKPGAVGAPGWTEIHRDETVQPGHWRLKYGAHTIDILEQSISVDNATSPKGSTIILK